PDGEHVARTRVRPQRGVTLHREVDGVVADPFHRDLHDAGRLAVVQDLVRLVVGHQGRIVLEAEFLDDVHRRDREVPRRRTNPSWPGSGAVLQYVGAAQRQFSLLGRLEGPDSLVNPAVHCDLVAFGRIAAY